jgi:acetolactate synthase-1/3 small subunit
MNGSMTNALTTLHLSVNNHPGVLSHVCGLFAGRAYNLEGVLVTPEANGDTCRMWLVVKDDGRMEQIVKQVRKLHDVLDVQVGHAEPTVFNRLAGCLEC